jgi:hypothetical protein
MVDPTLGRGATHVAASIIALVAAFHGGSHGLPLRASRWGTFREIVERRRNKNSSFNYP